MIAQISNDTESTHLEFVVCRVLKLQGYGGIAGLTQGELDANTPEIMERVHSEHITDHMRAVYNETVGEYANNPHTQYVTDDLIAFIEAPELKEGDHVLDLGCGPGRDAWFMATSSNRYRESLMQRETDGHKTIDAYAVPRKALRVTAIDASERMLGAAIAQGAQVRMSMGVRYAPLFQRMDIQHDLAAFAARSFKGVWSCAAFLTHTPQDQVEPVLEEIARILDTGGIFAVSYTQSRPGQAYDYLKVSSTGRIKYFSHPKVSEIVDLAQKHGLELTRQTMSDYVDIARSMVIKDLFVSQFFRKM